MASTSSSDDEIVVDMEKLVNSMKHNLGTLGKRSENREGGCVIRRVLPSLRRDFEEDYVPKIISIGPLHRNNEALKPMEALKWKYLRQLMERNPERNKLEKYIKAVHSVKEAAMKFYEPDERGTCCNNLDGGFDDFVEMMVLDGCFLIECLLKYYWIENAQNADDVNLNQPLPLLRPLPPLRRDLLLLENQIPFIILETLFNSSYIPTVRTSVTLMELAVCFVTMHMAHSVSPIPDPTIHLLHVYHASLRPTPNYHASLFSFSKMRRRIRRLAAAPFWLLLSCLLTCKIPTNFWGYRSTNLSVEEFCRELAPREIPSATQLYNLGVDCTKKKHRTLFLLDPPFDKEDITQFFFDATFDKEEGILEIPMFPVQQVSTFCNLVAFEQMYPTNCNHITSHAVLMSCLIGAAEDVAMLKDSGIIHGPLKDVQVAEVFAQLRMGYNLHFYDHQNRDLFRDVLDYCRTAHNKWRADFKRTYFGSPWTVASMIAAAYILLLTSAQTFYAIYAYHHPPSS